jgi:hypothetical protein
MVPVDDFFGISCRVWSPWMTSSESVAASGPRLTRVSGLFRARLSLQDQTRPSGGGLLEKHKTWKPQKDLRFQTQLETAELRSPVILLCRCGGVWILSASNPIIQEVIGPASGIELSSTGHTIRVNCSPDEVLDTISDRLPPSLTSV